MKLRIIILFLLITCLSAQSYFLNENDFNSNFEALSADIRGSSYIYVLWDSAGRVSQKQYFNENGDLASTERFLYGPDSDDILKKEILDPSGVINKETIFGPELHAEKFIKYLFQVDTVEVWENRFTRTHYIEFGKPYLYEFFDVNGFQFGNIGFSFTEDGILTTQLWITLPDKKIIREWTYEFNPSTEVTRIREYDSLKTLVDDVSLYKDGTHSLFWFTGPADSSYINEPRLSFLLKNDLDWGRILFTPAANNEDTVSSRIMKLSREMVNKGEFNYVKFILNPPLVDGGIYNIAVEGKSKRGLIITKRHIKHLVFDQTAPEMVLETAGHINSPALEITSSEPVLTASVIFKPDSILYPDRKEIRVFLPQDAVMSSHEKKVTAMPEVNLEDSVTYHILVSALDRAGNRGYSNIRHNINYDVSPPLLNTKTVADNGAFNNSDLVLSISEVLSDIQIVYYASGGRSDNRSPHKVEYFPAQLKSGTRTFGLPGTDDLNDGTIYSIEITGTDSAGNASEPMQISSVLYDVTPPVITMIFPYENAAIRDPAISYAVSEDLEHGLVIWEPDSLAHDSVKHIQIELNQEEKRKGEKIHFDLDRQEPLVDGVIYSLKISGIDRAGNQAETVFIPGIVYDITPPEFHKVEPTDNTFANSSRVGYAVSENLKEGSVIWTAITGPDDPDSPHISKLVGKELRVGERPDAILVNEPYLVDSVVYNITFTGIDYAGNKADTVTVENFHFDVSPPQLALTQPLSDSHINDSLMTFSIGENLESGKLIWTPVDAGVARLKDHVYELHDNFLGAGTYDSIKFKDFPYLTEGVTYNLSFVGIDKAGNENPDVFVGNITYDFQPPVLTLSNPQSNTAVNTKKLNFIFNEVLRKATVHWEWIAGEEDETGTHNKILETNEVQAGHYTDYLIFNEPNLVNNALYRIWIEGEDLAGNYSQSVVLDSVEYDNIVPEIAVDSIQPGMWLNTAAISYTNSEDLEREIFKWNSSEIMNPLVVELSRDQRSAGEKPDFELVHPDDLIEGIPYSLAIYGNDRASNITDTLIFTGLKYDFTPPQITMSWPEKQAAVNSFRHSYTLSENLRDLTLEWIWKGGKGDESNGDVQEFTDIQKTVGDHLDEMPRLYPSVMDGGIYDLVFSGSDSAGNRSNVIRIENVLYDITPPEIIVSHPQPHNYIATPGVNMQLSEDVHTAEISYRNTGGMEDSAGVHLYTLEGEMLQKGSHTDLAAAEEFLVEGAEYTITINAMDRAGNTAETITVPGVVYDATPPILAIHDPIDDKAVNSTEISFESSEYLESGIITWERKSGAADRSAPHIYTLTGDDLGPGIHDLDFGHGAISLNDSTVYEIRFAGKDPAGNEGVPAVVSGVLFDVSPPVLALDGIDPDSWTNSADFVYEISEDIAAGTIMWSGQTASGTAFNFEFILDGEDLAGGSYSSLSKFDPGLSDGGVYSVRFLGTDPAGNEAQQVTVENIRFDVTPPDISVTWPGTGMMVNTYRMEYHISEPVRSGKVSVSNASETYEVELAKPEIQAGPTSTDRLASINDYAERIPYTLDFSVTDLAGNTSVTETIKDVQYDFTPPDLTVLSPDSGSFINSNDVVAAISEDLQSAALLWIYNTDTTRYNIPGEKLAAGEVNLTDYPIDLTQDNVYDVQLMGIDIAGNRNSSVINPGITYDKLPPVLTVLNPVTGDAVNKDYMLLDISESLRSLKVIWQDPYGTKVEKDLSGILLSAGEHQVIEPSLELADGSVYSIRLYGTDLAGNTGISLTVDSVKYDVTPPVVSLTSPASRIITNVLKLTGALSEPVAKGTLTITGDQEEASHAISADLINGDLAFNLNLKELNVLPFDSGMVNLSFQVQDPAGNYSEELTRTEISFDQRPPRIILTNPENRAYVTNNDVTYAVSEEMSTAEINFEWVGGTGDSSLSQKVLLSKSEAAPGLHEGIRPENISSLNDGSAYSVIISGKDMAGNSGISNKINWFKYDVTPPEGEILSPVLNSFNNRILFSGGVSENLKSCDLEIIPELENSGTPAKLNLIDEQWDQTSISNLDLGKYYRFSTETSYTFVVSGQDSAGNKLLIEPVTGVIFDNIPPVLSMALPVDEEQIKETIVSYNTSEDLNEGWVTFTEEPAGKSVKALLKGANMTKGWHQDVVLPLMDSLSDGSRYKVELGGVDRAGNKGETIAVHNVLFDFMPPVLAIKVPGEYPYINDEIITYSSSEKLREGRLTFRRVSGAPDPASPHTFELTGAFLEGGLHEEAELPGLSLLSGAGYEIRLEGSDRANNVGDAVVLDRIIFDNIPPEISDVHPDTGLHLNNLLFNYKLSETMLTARIDLTSPSGSPVSYTLSNQEKKGGMHENLDLIEKCSLTSDGVYDLTVSGMDTAGNNMEPLLIRNITIDRIPPSLSSSYPAQEKTFNRTAVAYDLSEDLGSLQILVNNVENNTVGPLVNTFNMSDEHLKTGSFSEVPLEALEGSLVHGNEYIYTFRATDLAGNSIEIVSEGLIYDIEAPELTLVSPAGNNISNTDLDFTLNEPLVEGIIEWNPHDGSAPLAVPFMSGELKNLDFGPGKLTAQKPLTDGVRYMLSFRGSDFAGNTGEQVLLDSVLFDLTSPGITILSPEDGKAVNEPVYSFKLSEDLISANVKWIEKPESGQEVEPQVFELSGELLKGGEHGPWNLPKPSLENGKVYALVVEGTDLAGNRGNPARVNDITFDTELPVLEIVKPDTGDFTNKTSFGIKTSEPLELGRIYLENTGGVNDPESPRILEISGNRLTPVKPSGQKLGLIDGAVYTIRFEGQDYAGNKGVTIEVPDVTFDNTLPDLSIAYPVPDEVHNNKAITYYLSEDLLDGRITWVATGGKHDPGSPHILQLEGEQLRSGTHRDTVSFNFVEGTVYSIELAGRDLAENPGTKFKTPYVSYDFTKPVLDFLPLEYGKYLNHKKVSYSMNENLFDAKIAWIKTDDASIRVEVGLSAGEAKAGDHKDIMTSESPALVDGTSYRVEFTGRDKGGNFGEPAFIGEIVYDVTHPTVEIVKPVAGYVTIIPEITMNISEPLRLAIIYWNATEGATDSIGHYEVKMTPEELVMLKYENYVFEDQVPLNPGTVYSMSITGLDSAWNEIPIQDVRNISVTRKLDGNWYFKGAIMTVVWSFESKGGKLGETGRITQGVQMGTKISNQESGTYKLDYSKKPWVMEWELESGQKRYSLFEIKGPDRLRVITGTKLPASWEDGEIMIYENR